ncbi:hypothetical protein BHU72_04380 [Desulfuribacillus stibiiarsenatis]|uniref:Hydrolase n=1 Tax=Desulfuribacillus stibiiarsenatis TaxID=1390249 RepID=A0A1E5L5B8_9FIRM|nr:HAD family hydrolase [Desulfuribacillus stibiiarsenatis]OEH85337.1 hypothetical protein BHU72_04380 [Desulfuribacillus stibiiarsenatis]
MYENILLICDMDGTLLNSKDEISKENIEAIEEFKAKGGLFTIATGRKESSVIEYLQQVPINAPAILYNGSLIYDFNNQQVLWERELDYDVQEILLDIVKRFPNIGIEIYQKSNIRLIKDNEYTQIHRSKEEYPYIIHSLVDLTPPWRKVLIAAETDTLTEIEQYMMELFANQPMPFRICRSERYFLEWLPTNVSKGKAIEVLKEQFGFANHNIITAGNETNDLEMLAEPNIGFAVENAHPDAKSVAKYICANHNEHPIREIIHRLQEVIR